MPILEHHRVIGGAVHFSLNHAFAKLDRVNYDAMHLRNATHGVGILNFSIIFITNEAFGLVDI